MNRWKMAFFTVLGCWVASVAVAAYVVIDGWVSLGYLHVSYADCAAHRDFLDALVERRLTRTEIDAQARRVTWSANGYQRVVEPKEIQIRYDAHAKYVGSRFGGSTSGDF